MAIEKRNIEKRTPTTNENDTDEARDLQFENLLQSDHPCAYVEMLHKSLSQRILKELIVKQQQHHPLLKFLQMIVQEEHEQQ